jgi:hypothetical protein
MRSLSMGLRAAPIDGSGAGVVAVTLYLSFEFLAGAVE